MRRPRTTSPLDTQNAPWLDPTPPGGGGVDGGGDVIVGGYLHRRRASPPAPASPRAGWFAASRTTTTIASTTTTTSRTVGSTRESPKTTILGAAKTMLYQLVLWPLTLSMMLASSVYRFTLRVGCRGSPLRFRDPPRWLVRLISKPGRLMNPPISFGANNLKGCAGGAAGVAAAAAAARGHQRERGDGSGGDAGGGAVGGGGRGGGAATAVTAAAAPSLPHSPVLLVGNQSLLGLDSLAVLNEVCMIMYA